MVNAIAPRGTGEAPLPHPWPCRCTSVAPFIGMNSNAKLRALGLPHKVDGLMSVQQQPFGVAVGALVVDSQQL